jgi:hypothetical protein
MIIEIKIWEIIIIFVLILIYYLFRAGLNLAVYKRASQELDKTIQGLHTIDKKTKYEKKK